MSLTTGRGPLSRNRAGRFSAPVPDGVVYVEPFRRRVRGVTGDRTLVDSERALLVHRAGRAAGVRLPGRRRRRRRRASPSPRRPATCGCRGTRSRPGTRRTSRSSSTRATRTTGSTACAPAGGCGSRSPASCSSTPPRRSGCTRPPSIPSSTSRRDQVPPTAGRQPDHVVLPLQGHGVVLERGRRRRHRRRRRLVLRGPAARVPPDQGPAELRRGACHRRRRPAAGGCRLRVGWSRRTSYDE